MDDLFSPADSSALSPPDSPTLEPNSSSTPAPPAQPPTPAAPNPAFVPRAIKRKAPPTRRPLAAALLANSTSSTSATTTTTPSTSAAAVAAPPSLVDRTVPDLAKEDKDEKLSNAERDRLEGILQAVEGGMSDWGVSMYGRSGGETALLTLLERGDGRVHISQVLQLQNVRALTLSMPDVQKAIRLRESPIVQLDEAGFKVGRKVKPDYERLRTMDLTEWDETIVYLENIPFMPSADHSLSVFLSSILPSHPQHLILPPLFDRDAPSSASDNEDDDSDHPDAVPSQSALFAASRAGESGRVKRPKVPKGGGPFKGFAFVVCRDMEEAKKVTDEWKWEGSGETQLEERKEEEENVEGEDEKTGEVEDEGAGQGEEGAGEAEKKSGKATKRKLTPHERAKAGGLRALSYANWLSLKAEYLSYRRSLTVLLEARESGSLDRLRNPPTRDRPPHLAGLPPSSDGPNGASMSSKRRRASPNLGEGDEATLPPALVPHPHNNQERKRRRAPSPILERRIARLRTPSPAAAADLGSSSALGIQGAYPEGCVVWVRNVHEKSTKTSLKNLFAALLEELQEGSGKGVEFVDYEKGTMACYLRFASASLSLLAYHHLSTLPSLHLSQSLLTPASSLSPASLSLSTSDARRPLVAELLVGDQERRYWSNVPEAARKRAREAARSRVGLLKLPKPVGVGEVGKDGKGKTVYRVEYDVDEEEEEEDKPVMLPAKRDFDEVDYDEGGGGGQEEWQVSSTTTATGKGAEEGGAAVKKRKKPSRM